MMLVLFMFLVVGFNGLGLLSCGATLSRVGHEIPIREPLDGKASPKPQILKPKPQTLDP